jgi:hypothetical protein
MKAIRIHLDRPWATLLMMGTLLTPWLLLELMMTSETPNYAIALGFLIGLASYPVFYLIYTLSIGGNISTGLAGVGLSFIAKVVIVIISISVLWGVWKVDLRRLIPPMFYSLLSFNFFAIYFAKQ